MKTFKIDDIRFFISIMSRNTVRISNEGEFRLIIRDALVGIQEDNFIIISELKDDNGMPTILFKITAEMAEYLVDNGIPKTEGLQLIESIENIHSSLISRMARDDSEEIRRVLAAFNDVENYLNESVIFI